MRPAIFSARCNIFISRLCYDVSVRLSVRLSVTEVHCRIIANLGFKFRSQFTAHIGRDARGRERRDHRRHSCSLSERHEVTQNVFGHHMRAGGNRWTSSLDK